MKNLERKRKLLFWSTLTLIFTVALISDVAAQQCVPPPDGLISWWPLDETSGTIAVDIIDGNDGTHVGDTTPMTGKVGSALSFDGVNDYVDVPSTVGSRVTGSFTIEAWIYPRDLGSIDQIFVFIWLKGGTAFN